MPFQRSNVLQIGNLKNRVSWIFRALQDVDRQLNHENYTLDSAGSRSWDKGGGPVIQTFRWGGGGGGKRTHSARGAKKVWIFSCFGPRSDIDCWNNQGMVLIWNWVWFLDNVKYYALLFSCTHGIRLWHLYKKFGRSWAIMLMHPSKIRHRIFGHARNKEGKTLNSG